jgi:DNA-binding MarR family transcriptional regulator
MDGAALLFARANPFSRTPSAFAEFQATTRGTATQTIKALEAGGYLVRQRSEADGRSVSLRLTDKGHEALARDPFEVLVGAVDSLDAQEQTAMHHALHQVLTTVAASGAHRPFGVCRDCAYLGGETCCSSAGATIGRRAAIIAFAGLRLKGWLAWWIWGIAHIYFLISLRNRLIVATQWLWSYVTFERGARLITGTHLNPKRDGHGRRGDDSARPLPAQRGSTRPRRSPRSRNSWSSAEPSKG